jgi:hypothetical protein
MLSSVKRIIIIRNVVTVVKGKQLLLQDKGTLNYVNLVSRSEEFLLYAFYLNHDLLRR